MGLFCKLEFLRRPSRKDTGSTRQPWSRSNSTKQRCLISWARPPPMTSAPERVDRIETHASVVFLAGTHAYKVKRAVKYPFLDFSTLERRRSALLNELRRNLRTAPQLYLEVVSRSLRVTTANFTSAERAMLWSGCCVMRRFDQAKLYDRMAEQGRLQLSAMPQLAQVIAAFHRGANRNLAPQPAVEALHAVIKDNATTLATREDGLPGETLAQVNRLSREALAALSLLLQARALGGYVRHCHGDLHLRNIVEIDGAPDIVRRHRVRRCHRHHRRSLRPSLSADGSRRRGDCRAHANAVLNAYLEASGDTANLIGLAALPLFLSMRAMIRAKVELLRARSELRLADRGPGAAWRPTFLLARDYLERTPTARSSSPLAVCRGAASRAWRRRLRRISVRFRVRCMCGATSSASACLASTQASGFLGAPMPRRSPISSMASVASAL